MALTKTTLPAIAPTHAVPYDVAASFGLGITMTASGYAYPTAGGATTTNYITMGPGRMEGYWRLDVSAAKVSAGNEFYQFFLLGSNDPAFANGNIDILGMYDIAATAALRDLPTIAAASPAVPDGGLTASSFVIPMSNQRDQFVFEFINLYANIGGTSPTITFSSWVAPWTGQKM